MKIHLISDLHLEVSDYQVHSAGLAADVIILAGDIGVGMNGIEFAQDLLKSFKGHVIYLCGNHEFYRHDINVVRQKIREFCGVNQRLHFLDNDEVVIDGVRFVGSTLWTDFALFGEAQKPFCMIDGGRCLNDFRLIRNGDRNFTVQDSIDQHNESIRFLEMKLKKETFAGQTVVVTHHAPSYQSVVPRFAHDLLSACFASNLDHLLGFSSLWCHGHMHDSLAYEVRGTKVLCNPRGYTRYDGAEENGQFDPSLIVEI